jgi:hypothetical protein
VGDGGAVVEVVAAEAAVVERLEEVEEEGGVTHFGGRGGQKVGQMRGGMQRGSGSGCKRRTRERRGACRQSLR